MAFLEQRLDSKITEDVVFTETNPGRTIARLRSGKIGQDFPSSMPMTICDLVHGIRSAAEYQTVVDAWYIVNFTPYTGLRVKNWRDFRATQANTALTFITGSTWQLQRKHTFGGATFLRNIKKPCASPAVVIYRTRDSVVSTASATVDTTTGIATISGHVEGDTYTWTGEFDLPMTFTDNEWRATLKVHIENLHIASGSILMEELKL